MFITAGITSLCEQELKIVRAAKTCYAGRTLPTPALEYNCEYSRDCEYNWGFEFISPKFIFVCINYTISIEQSERD